jgi:hypothetical protein
VTDFLHRQIARAGAGIPEPVRPRLPSLFEPTAPDSAVVEPLDEGAEVEQTLASPVARWSRPARPEPADLDAAGPPVVTEGPTGPSAKPLPAATTSAVTPARALALPSGVEHAREGDTGRSPPAPARQLSTAAHRPEDAGLAAPAEPPQSARPARVAATLAPRRETVALAPQGVSRTAERDREATGAAPRAVLSPAPSRTPAARPTFPEPAEMGPRAGASGPAFRSFAPAVGAAAPTIEVTIGRIEVKAAPATAAPPATRRQAPPGPSELETYLRGKGGRRS